jgi:hypothetical protein
MSYLTTDNNVKQVKINCMVLNEEIIYRDYIKVTNNALILIKGGYQILFIKYTKDEFNKMSKNKKDL